jgi:hypothetical protein
VRRTVAVVADTSALTTYARLDGLAVGELLAEIEDDPDGLVIGVPVTAFLDAYRQLDPDGRERLVILVTDPDRATVVLPLAAENAFGVLAYDRATLAESQCMADAVTHRAPIATYGGDVYRKHLPASISDDLVLDLIEP